MAEAMAPRMQSAGGRPWWAAMTRYHWLVLAIASMSWLFDCMDQRFFNIARDPAMRSLLYGKDFNSIQEDKLPEAARAEHAAKKAQASFYGRVATAMILLGWAVGGFFFGMLGDRIGRVKTMMVTIMVYAGFTGLSALSVAWWDFIAYRFLMGLGVGGLFAAAVSLVAEVTPPEARPHALGLLQAFSATGNILGSAITLVFKPQTVLGGVENWRWLFVVGVLPALLVILIQKKLKEPETWQKARSRASEDLQRQLGGGATFFSPKLRRRTLVGLGLAVAGVIGLWGVGFFSPELVRNTLKAAGFSRAVQDDYVAYGLMLQDTGAFFGVYFFTVMAARLGRKPAFGLCFLLAFAATVGTFLWFRQPSDIFWMLPILGFANLSVFGGYSIYFPELYPTRLRSSGVGFCYNVGRVITAAAIFGSGYLLAALEDFKVAEPFRVGSVILACVYFLGIIVLPFAPETRGRPLEED